MFDARDATVVAFDFDSWGAYAQKRSFTQAERDVQAGGGAFIIPIVAKSV